MSGEGYINRDAFLGARGVLKREDGSWWEDSYDYGLYWYDSDRRVYRLTWIGPIGRDSTNPKPGELYIEDLRSRTITHLCTIPPTEYVEETWLARGNPAFNVDQILTGWADVCGEPNSLAWLQDRVREALEAGWAT